MALIVEDGTGLADAESYVSVARARELEHIHRFDPTLQVMANADVFTMEAALREVTGFMDANYHWLGVPTNPRVQALGFPRSGIIDDQGREVPDDSVPPRVERCATFLLVHALQSRLETVEAGAAIKSRAVGLVATVYGGEGLVKGRRRFREADTLLSGLYYGLGIGSASGQVEILRA